MVECHCNAVQIQDAIEALDADHLCEQYWQGKADRMSHAAGIPVARRANPHATKSNPAKPRKKRNRCASPAPFGRLPSTTYHMAATLEAWRSEHLGKGSAHPV